VLRKNEICTYFAFVATILLAEILFLSTNFFAQIAAGKIILSRSILVATLHSTLPATALCFRDIFVDGIW